MISMSCLFCQARVGSLNTNIYLWSRWQEKLTVKPVLSAGCVVTWLPVRALSAATGSGLSETLLVSSLTAAGSKSDDEGKIEKSLVVGDNMAVQCDPHSYSRPPNWLERTFLYTFGGY